MSDNPTDSAGTPASGTRAKDSPATRRSLVRRTWVLTAALGMFGAGMATGVVSVGSEREMPAEPTLQAEAASSMHGMRVCVEEDLWVVVSGSDQSIPGHPETRGRLLVVGGCSQRVEAAAEVFVRDDRCPSLETWLAERTAQWEAALVAGTQAVVPADEQPGAAAEDGAAGGAGGASFGEASFDEASDSSSDSSTATEPQQGDFLRDGIELLPDETGESAPFSPEECYYTTGDLPPMADLLEQIAGLDAQLSVWLEQIETERIEAERLEAERLEAERAAAERAAPARRTSSSPRQSGVTAPTTGTDSGTGAGAWEEPEQYDPFSPDYEPDWDEDPNGGFYGVENDIPPMPDGCKGGLYDSRWGWSCG